jgi:glycosyltransferase involved in cell wall biosynthesis
MRSASAKRLTYIVNYLSADDAQHYVHIPNLLVELEKLGWEIDLVSERGGTGTAELLGRRVTFLSLHSKPQRVVNLVRHLLNMRRSGGTLVFVRISKFAALFSAIAGRLFGWKTVYWLSGTVEDFNLRNGAGARLQFAGMWLLFHLVDRLATGPETMVGYYRRLYGLPQRKVVLLYNDIDLGQASGRDAAKSDRLNVLIVHRLSPVRETDRYFPALLDALERFARTTKRAVRLDICGEGPEREQLETMAARASRIDVQFQGAVPQRALRRFYDDAAIFIMPSYREGFPRVMIEAMAHGLPIVATDAGGTRDLCGPAQQEYVIDRDDPAAFGTAVERLLRSPGDRKRLAAENLQSVQRFGTPNVARMYDRALSPLVGLPPAQ